ncbi:transporter substrate-binding domain-containing protein [Kovacikia minuta CCNUW1]|uniref:transporter substrate-binding domain-containing protein n=1 Tax=Kovacikia minuta TaxID=2931930 RepID=UPI001CCEAE38|nr:transporter substrate-binding domain-containing protein [Kovacikia minuta]UBF25338.1 transporter substrate-binding domain-containing protein [Kovacikia minuta CCNUW1]
MGNGLSPLKIPILAEPHRVPCWFLPILSFGLVGLTGWVPAIAHAEELKTIQDRGQLVIAVKDNLPPLGFRSADGALQGLEIDIAKRLAQDLVGKSNAFVLKPVLNQDRLQVVLSGQADIVIARVTMTVARSRVVSFSTPYYVDGTALVTKDPTIRSPFDLTNQTIAVLDRSSTVDTVRNRLPGAKLVGVASYEAARSLLEKGEATAFAADASLLSGWVQEFPQYRLLTPTLSVEPLCIVIPKGLQYEELRQKINEALARWQREGWLQERVAFWKLP